MTLPLTPSGYYSTKELAQLFHADESTIKRWANGGKLRCFKTPGGHRKFTPQHVIEFINAYQYEIAPAFPNGISFELKDVVHVQSH